ncbi:unnamed protein product [Rhizophagus irregularis]|nr:unnamed protein product [Rhizophagus irregularis]
MEKNNPFLVTGTLENQMTDKPEKLDYKTAADKLTRCLRDIVSTSVSADTIRAGINSSGKAKLLAISEHVEKEIRCGLEDVIDSNKHKSEPIDLKRKISKSSISDHNNNDRKIFTHVLFA